MCSQNYHWHHDYVRLAWDSGFAFNLHRTKLNYDWSSIGLLDIDRVIRDRDVASIEKHMSTVLNYSLDEEQTRILEPTFVKVFQLSQLSVQYLQFCKRYLDNTVVLLKKELGKHKEDNAELKDSVEDLKNEIQNLKKKVKELKQSQIQSQSIENILPTSFKCNTCSKVFLSEDFLIAHIKRRHEVDTNPYQTETDRLQLEIKELKERLNSTEKYIQGDHNTKSVLLEIQENIPNNDQAVKNSVHMNDLKDKFDHLKQYVERELTVLRDEKYYQEKYEKWFNMVFQRLDNSRKELQDKEDSKTNIIADSYELIRKDSSTQTVAGKCVESETMTDEIPCTTSVERLESKSVKTEIDMQKIQSDIITNTESHLDQIQGVLEKKLSGGFEQIQSQMNTFWKKLSDIELEKQSSTTQSQIIHSNISSSPNKFHPQIKMRKKPRSPSLASASSSESLAKPRPAIVQPKPAPRVTKILPTIIQSKPKETISASPIRTPNMKPKTLKILQKNYFTDDSSSDDTFEIVKPPVKVVSAKQTSRFDGKPVITTTKSKSAPTPVKMQYKEDTQTSASETEEQDTLSEEPQVKPSNTSTLGQRSLTSLKMITKDKDVMTGLKRELEEMVNLRLKEIGISPNWNGIPDRSYKQAIQVVKHHSDLSGKKLPNYWKAREAILKILNDKIKKKRKGDKQHFTEKEKKEKEAVIKQPVIKKQTKQEKKSIPKTTVDTTYIVDINSEDSNTKLNTTKEIVNKENIAITPTNPIQEKITTILQTPIKKKVLFDLEDSSSASKTNINNIEIVQNQKAIENNIISPKKQGIKEITVAKVSVQKFQKPAKINDGGSTTSLASSILEAPKLKQINPADTKVQNLTKDDVSDWDISDILT